MVNVKTTRDFLAIIFVPWALISLAYWMGTFDPDANIVGIRVVMFAYYYKPVFYMITGVAFALLSHLSQGTYLNRLLIPVLVVLFALPVLALLMPEIFAIYYNWELVAVIFIAEGIYLFSIVKAWRLQWRERKQGKRA